MSRCCQYARGSKALTRLKKRKISLDINHKCQLLIHLSQGGVGIQPQPQGGAVLPPVGGLQDGLQQPAGGFINQGIQQQQQQQLGLDGGLQQVGGQQAVIDAVLQQQPQQQQQQVPLVPQQQIQVSPTIIL